MTTIAATADALARRYRDPNHEVVSCDAWYDYINQAWQQIQRATSQWPWNKQRAITVTVTGGQRRGCLAEDGSVYELTYVYDTTNQRGLRQATENGTDARYSFDLSTTSVASPDEYRVNGKEIEVFPTPSGTITLEVGAKQWAAAPVAYNDSLPIPEAFQSVVIDGALMLAREDDSDFPASQAAAQRFEKGIIDMVGSFLNGQEGMYPAMPIDFS